MRLRHLPADGDPRVLATEIDIADSLVSRARGLTFRRSIPEDYALVFRFSRPAQRALHMLFVPFPIDAVWTVGGTVTRVERLRPWVGFGRGRADVVVELPAGAADGVAAGDELRLAGQTDA